MAFKLAVCSYVHMSMDMPGLYTVPVSFPGSISKMHDLSEPPGLKADPWCRMLEELYRKSEGVRGGALDTAIYGDGGALRGHM
jgi:hypothetical protein